MKSPKLFDRYQTAEWGTFCRYLELAKDLFASRQVDVYLNGNCLRFDRDNWVDVYGMLADARHTAEYERLRDREWSSEEISQEEFESVWKHAQNAPNQPQEYDTASFEPSDELRARMTAEQVSRLPPWFGKMFDPPK